MQRNIDIEQSHCSTDIAIIGTACRFPGADNPEKFWDNLIHGVESIQRFTKEELTSTGISDDLLENPHFVPAKGILNGIDLFDASFFGYNAHDAKMTDPQQRIFLECSWEALESAGYASENFEGLIGVYASMSDSLYLQNNLLKNKKFMDSFNWFQTHISTSLTTLSTQLSYRLNLTGPSINITTACSSSLVAVATACRALVDYECDMAIAGAIVITVPNKNGYLYQEEGIDSPDGHCRAFDANAKGTVFGNGVGVVILKRLSNAIEDGDDIQAVIKGWSVNNDGANKVGFSAPSAIGQAQCIASALSFADIDSSSISYIEAHGTGTLLGDPIEVNALKMAFDHSTDKKQFCGIGSVKTNIGHIDIASGMASLIKVILSLQHKMLPPTLHYQDPNPEIDFVNSPFYVNHTLKPWHVTGPRRAGINASGIGGTNAFLVLEEHSTSRTQSTSRHPQLLLISAKTELALEARSNKLIDELEKINTHEELANLAYTLQVGRAGMNFRRSLVCHNTEEALQQLKSNKRMTTKKIPNHNHPNVVFMFSGQGTQYPGMASALYLSEPEFAEIVNLCCHALNKDLKEKIMLLLQGTEEEKLTLMNDPLVTQPWLFVIEYSLAKFLMHLGIKPDALIGHSFGEYLAATVSGVMDLNDALKLITYRAEIMAKTESGLMLAVLLEEAVLIPYLKKGIVSLAAINSFNSCVISGEVQEINRIKQALEKDNVPTKLLRTHYGFHSALMDPILAEFQNYLQGIPLHSPTIPYISNLTGNWIKDEEAKDPHYWVAHLRQTIKFSEGTQTLLRNGSNIFIEIGPGRTLCSFVNELSNRMTDICVQHTLPQFKEDISDQARLLMTLGTLWQCGLKPNWEYFYKREKRLRIKLPTYPFERKSYWIDADKHQSQNKLPYQKQDYEKWFYEPSWTRTSLKCDLSLASFFNQTLWIVFLDKEGFGEAISLILEKHHQKYIKIHSGKFFSQVAANEFVIDIQDKNHYYDFIKIISNKIDNHLQMINLLPLSTEHDLLCLDKVEIHNTLYHGFYSQLFFTQAMLELHQACTVNCLMVTNEAYSVLGTETIYPAKACATGPCRVIPQEHPNIKISLVDVILSEIKNPQQAIALGNQIILETLDQHRNNADNIIAYRGAYRWVQAFKAINLDKGQECRLKDHGAYLFTGGLGGISLTLAKYIASACKSPTVFLLTRASFPKSSEWHSWLSTNGLDHPISRKIILLQEIQALGAQIIILEVDITNFEVLKKTINDILQKHPGLSGVVHAAGVPGGGILQFKTPEMVEQVFAPKVEGTYYLSYLLRHHPLDFFILCSSISAVTGESSLIDYCAANACLDAFTNTSILMKTKLFTTINWNTWREIGMAADNQSNKYFNKGNDIAPIEGARIFADILSSQLKQVIISTYDIDAYSELVTTGKNIPDQQISDTTMLSIEKNSYPEAGNEIEAKLMQIWQETLSVDKIGLEDDFIELGGHSLMALRILSKIDKVFNVKVNLRNLLQENRCIKDLAKKIEASLVSNSYVSNLIVPIRSEGTKPPLFCLHPVSGTVFCYINLAKHLRYDCPIYGLQDPSIEQNKLLFDSLEKMASQYIQSIQEIQRHGPYWLCGLSFGATLAVELARQLRAKGERVMPLISFDGWAKFSDEQHHEKIFKTAILERTAKISDNKIFVELSWERMKLLLQYSIPHIQDKIMLFKARDLLPEYQEIDNPSNYWDNHTNTKVEVHSIPGDHETILDEPNVNIIAGILDLILEEYQKELEDYDGKQIFEHNTQ